MAKTRVGVLLRESVGGKPSSNHSADLNALATKYQTWCKQIRSLLEALQKHHEALKLMHATRGQIALNFAGMTKGTPLWESVGVLPSADRPSDSVCSYSSVHDNLGAKTSSYVEKYRQFVLEYAIEWEKVVTTRINDGLKKSDQLRRDLDHYQKKVEALRLSVNQNMAKGKSVKNETQERLRRNEEKLLGAKQSYNSCATDLCILMEEVTERSWRDLHPLVVKCAQFDSTLSNDESKVLASLNQVVSNLKNVATANGISPQPRLKDLASLKPELLSTRPGGVAGLAIEAGPPTDPILGGGSLSGVGGAYLTTQALQPGSLAASGLGGFPVQIASSSDPSAGPPLGSLDSMDPYSTSGSAKYDPPSTLSMLTISQSAAPPPSLDDVYGSTSRSAPPSGNYLPPLAPGSNPRTASGGFFQRGSAASTSFSGDNDSVNSSYSNVSYYSAPPNLAIMPSGPPPPPPSQPPPPPPPPSNYSMAQPLYSSTGSMPMSSSAPPPMMVSQSSGSYGQPQQQQQPMMNMNMNNGGYNPSASSPNMLYGGQPSPSSNPNPFNY